LAKENEIEKAIGNIEVGLSMGTSLGPVFASVFYQIGGYPLPFIILGSFLYISVYLTKMISKENIDSDNVEEDPPFFKLLTNLDILVIFTSFIFGMIAMTFYNPCLTYHLNNNYGMSISKASLFFIDPIISYFIMLQFLNIISNNLGYHCSMSLGLLLMVLGCYCTYPVPPVPKSLFSVIIGLMFIGLGGPPIYVPGLLALSKAVKANKIEEKTANDISSAMNNLSVSIGDLLGPILGGFFASNFGFKYCCLLISIIMLIFFILFVFYFFENIKNDVNSKLFLKFKNKSLNNQKNHSNRNQNHSFKNSRTGFNVTFQPIKKRKFSFQKNVEINLDNSLYSSLTK
jgi:predicted MFS family arabinose efflux permease